jgi:hypothetical protein
MIIYGGSEKAVKKQLKCEHDWHGPCMDNVSRYYKCKKCFCLDRDCNNEKEYYRLVEESEETNEK